MHRRVVAAVLSLAVLTGFAPLAQAGVDETTNFRVNPYKDNAVAGSALRPPLRPRWEVRLGNTRSNVVIAGGRVFFVSHDNVKGEVTALDAATGGVLWTRPAGPGTSGWALAYESGRLVVSRLEWGHDDRGRISVLDAADGALLWEKRLPEYYGVNAHPTVADGVLYVTASDGGTYLYALRLSDGAQLWRSGFMHSGSDSSPAVDAASVYLSWGGGQMYALARDSGAERWHYRTCCTGGGGSTVVVHRDLLFEMASGNLIHDAATGRVVGSFPGYSGGGALPAFAGDLALFVPHGLSAVDPAGRELWRYMPYDTYDHLSWPVVAGGHVYVREGDEFLTAVDLATGRPAWCGAFIPPPGSEGTGIGIPAVGHGLLVVPVGYALVALEGGAAASGCPSSSGGPGSVPAGGGDGSSGGGDGSTGGGDGSSGGAGTGPNALSLRAVPEDVDVGERTKLVGTAPPGRTVVLQADPHPFGRYVELAKVQPAPDGAFAAELRPRRNTRVRAVAGDAASDPVTVYVDHAARLRRRGRVLQVTVVAPRRAPISRRRFAFYIADRRIWRRVGVRRPRRTGSRLVARQRYPWLDRRTRVLVCTREPRPDGYGRPQPLDALCGRLTLPRKAGAAVRPRTRAG